MTEEKKKLSNWGNFPSIQAREFSVFGNEQIKKLLQNPHQILARGNGRCYGDAALNEHVISTLQLKHFLAFDESEGTITCESGVLFSDILNLVVPKGFFLPVTPGTKFITVGGAIAADIHGKNHHKEGCFSEFVTTFKIMIDSGEILTCSRSENPGIFWDTIGGMGLTGVILEATFKLKPIENSYICVESIKAKNLSEIMALFEASKDWTYTVAWIDCLQKGDKMGRSILMRGEHATSEQLSEKQAKNPLLPSPKKFVKIPFNFPGFALNTWSVKLFNWFYYHKQVSKVVKSTVHFEPFYYPLDTVLEWNRIYGASGFIQYQFVIPLEAGENAMREILEEIAESKQGSFLAVLKLFGAANEKAHNSFPIEGYTLALDFKVNKRLYNLVPKLDAIVKKYSGRIYRAKDSLSDSSLTNYVQANTTKFNSIQNQRIKEQETV
ncbi:MAG: FAD-linked oxidase [Flavobacteriaceae bacterium]|nr:FAD-linked oxidase [Flavobacteriaceae bacterium]|tara:strand:- start:18330 stop:19646 length:1317 start_codon:yes stop_codon:yes gene_type:complete